MQKYKKKNNLFQKFALSKLTLLLVLAGSCLVTPIAQAVNLYEIVEKTVLTNPTILEMYNNKVSREYEVKMAQGGFYPKLTFDASGGYQRTKNSQLERFGGGADVYRTANVTVTLKQMLFDGFLTKSESERQKMRVESAFFELYNLAEETAVSAIQRYVDVLMSQSFLQYAERNLKAHEEMYAHIEQRALSGVDDKSSLTQMTGRLKLAFSNVESERNNLQDRWTAFIGVVGFVPSDALEDVEFTVTLPETYQETLDYALSNHPALARSKADIEQFKWQKRASENYFYPRIELNLASSWTRNWGSNNSLVYDSIEDQHALLSFNWNLYNGGSDKARTDKDQFLRQGADEHLEWQRRRVEQDVAFAWNTYRSSARRLAFLEDYVRSTQETNDAYQKQFRIGERTLLDLLNTENEIFDARKELATVRYQHILAKYRVLASMGILLEKMRIGILTDERYRTDDINDPDSNDEPEKMSEHREREIDKRDSTDNYTDMRFFKMNNRARIPYSDEKYQIKSKPTEKAEDIKHINLNKPAEKNIETDQILENTTSDFESKVKDKARSAAPSFFQQQNNQ